MVVSWCGLGFVFCPVVLVELLVEQGWGGVSRYAKFSVGNVLHHVLGMFHGGMNGTVLSLS